GVAPITCTRDDLEADRRADRFRQSEVSIPPDPKVCVELILRKIVKSGAGDTTRIIAQHTLQEALNKTHRTGPLLNRDEQRESCDKTLGHRVKRSWVSFPS